MRSFTNLLAFVLFVSLFAFAQQKPLNKPAPKRNAREKSQQQQKQATPAQPAATSEAEKSAEEEGAEEKGPWHGLKYRLIGPFRGGRALAVAGVPGEDNLYYFGSVGGGVWKSTDGGLNWKNIFDKVKDASPSIGSIAVAPSDPNVIYVGTGEACIRGNLIVGNGVYKSTDAGKTWKFVGLRDTLSIGRVIVHPTNPDIAFVAALGHPFGPNAERGIFRTTDGGKTWEKVLYKDENTGGIDITFDPSNPRILFAGLWQARRTPWGFDSGGPGSGLYRSDDGGSTWKQLHGNGLPEGIMGRIGVTVSAADPNRIWALIEADKGGLFRSDDGGEHWNKVNEDRRFRQRAWYYTHVFADPKSSDTVYILNTGMYRSVDGGKTFATLPAPHGDHHGLWIDPTNPKRMIESNDGGANVSTDGGMSWTTQENQPTAQFYHVNTDNRFPYYVYGAQQDNSTVAIASASDSGLIDRTDWYDVGGGESGYVAPKPDDPNIVYAGSYGGDITRYDHRTKQSIEVTAWPLNPIGWAAADVRHRFQWTEPIVFSPHDPNVLYHASEVLWKSTDGGMSWAAISPDLTRNEKQHQVSSGGPITKDNTGVEVYNTIFSVVESPQKAGAIWVGSDDGLIHITQDGGQHWTDITPKDMPDHGLVSMIEASPFDAGTAYVAVERHKLDDFSPYIFKTTDYGKTWRRLDKGIPNDSYVHAVREDHQRKGLLYAGTEKGVFISFNDGAAWQPLQLNLPISPVNDLVVHDNDLVVATHGRAFWVLDDLTPLQQYRPEFSQQEAHLYKPAVASHTVFPNFSFFRAGNVGHNPPGGAVIYYSLKESLKKKEEPKPAQKEGEAKAGAQPQQPVAKPGETTAKPEPGQQQPPTEPQKPAVTEEAAETEKEAKPAEKAPDITLEILDSAGKVIRKYPPKKEGEEGGQDEGFGGPRKPQELPAEAGLNRFTWDLNYEGASRVPHSPLWGGSTDGPRAVPGKYQVRLTVKGKSYTEPLEIVADPRLKLTQQDYQAQFDLLMKIRDAVDLTDDTINQIRSLRKQIDEMTKRTAKLPSAKKVADAGKDLDKKITAVEEQLIQTKAKSSQDVLNYPIRLNNQLVALGGAVSSGDSRPTKQSYEVFDMLKKDLDTQMGKWQEVVKTDIPAYNNVVKNAEVPALILNPREEPGQ